jgi:hypothetical protein
MEIQRTPDKFTKYKKFSVFEIPEHIELYARHANNIDKKRTSFGELNPMIITHSDSNAESEDQSDDDEEDEAYFKKDSIKESTMDNIIESKQIDMKEEVDK